MYAAYQRDSWGEGRGIFWGWFEGFVRFEMFKGFEGFEGFEACLLQAGV